MQQWKDIIHLVECGQAPHPDPIVKTKEDWTNILDEQTYRITREGGTEAAGSGSHCSRFEPGIYNCSCCKIPLFDSTTKFESGSGWPSFDKPLEPNSIRYIKDVSYGMVRVEIQCHRCEAHLGHVFPDGPTATGLRYCVNSLSLLKAD